MLNKNLKAERARQGFSQLEISKKLGIAEATYNQKENGKREFTQKEMVLLSKLLKTSMDELFCDSY